MKKTICIVSIAFILMSMLASCQQTPESPIVVGKGDRQLEQKITISVKGRNDND